MAQRTRGLKVAKSFSNEDNSKLFMKIVVCLKQILDPDQPPREFRVDASGKQAERGSANLVTNIFCENALETALQLKEKTGDAEIIAVAIGASSAEDSLRKALAMKADKAVSVSHDVTQTLDSLTIARSLAETIKRIGGADLVLVGRESGDWGVGQTGGLLAEELGFPCVSFVDTIEKNGSGLTLRRQTDNGWEKVNATLPIVLTVTNNEFNIPRIPKTRDIMMSSRSPITKFTFAELGISATNDFFEVVKLFVPQKEANCEFVSGDTLDEKVTAFAEKIMNVAQGK